MRCKEFLGNARTFLANYKTFIFLVVEAKKARSTEDNPSSAA
jgi:hypothetical protein